MTRRLKRIAPLQAGKMLAITHALFSLLFIPFILLAGFVSAFAQPNHSDTAVAAPIAAGMMIVIAIVFPIFYGIFGFIFGVIGAALYNLIAKWVGGIEFEVEDVPRTDAAATSSLPIS